MHKIWYFMWSREAGGYCPAAQQQHRLGARNLCTVFPSVCPFATPLAPSYPVTIATGNAHKCWQLTRFCSRCLCCCCCCYSKIWQQHYCCCLLFVVWPRVGEHAFFKGKKSNSLLITFVALAMDWLWFLTEVNWSQIFVEKQKKYLSIINI